VAIVTVDKRDSCCEGCFTLGHVPDEDIACETCDQVYFCSWSCRAKESFHQFECSALKEAGMLPNRDETRVMLRAICKLQQTKKDNDDLLSGGGEGDQVPEMKEPRTFKHLLSHKDDFLSNSNRKDAIQTVYDEVEEFLGKKMPSFSIFVEILGRLYINGFEICDSKMITYGWGVYLGPSILDHSCQPNCQVTFKGNTLTVTTLARVESMSGAFISYLETSLPASIRQETLWNNYFFKCGCAKCQHSHRGKERKRQRGGRR